MIELPNGLALAAALVFAASLGYAAYTDLKSMRITNATCILGVATYAVYAIALLLSGDAGGVAGAIGVAVIVFAITATMNALNALGGGDVKLLTVAALWVGPVGIFDFAFHTALLGGGIALIMMAITVVRSGGVTVPASAPAIDARPIPYGPAITLAGLYQLSEPILNALY